MKVRTFFVFFSILVVLGTFFFYYSIQDSTLIVTVALDLTVRRESSQIPGRCQIIEETTNISIVKSPQKATEKVDLNLDYTYGETRTTPVRFIVSMYLNQTKEIVTTPNLTIAGRYLGFVSSFFSGIKPGTYNLRIFVYVFGRPENGDQLHRLVTVP